MRFDDERAKETIDGKGDLAFSFFVWHFFFLSELHHDRDAREDWKH